MSDEQQPSVPRVESTEALARFLGLSRWTVSRVLNGHPGVKGETRQRVLEAMRELGFTPSPMARGLRGSRTFMIGVCFQELESPALITKTSALQRLLRESGYRGILELTGGDPELESQVVRHFQAMRVDGIVLVASTLDPENAAVHELANAKAPVVAVDPLTDLPFPQIVLDRKKAMLLKMEHLHALGHRSFALLGFSDDIPYAAARLEGVEAAVARLQIPLSAIHRIALPGELHHDYSYGTRLIKKMLEMPTPPTALIALSDRIAIGAIHALRDAGREVPADFSVVGFDNLRVAPYLSPSLSSIDQQVDQMMKATVDTLLDAIESNENPQKNTTLLIEPVLKARGSTARCRPSF